MRPVPAFGREKRVQHGGSFRTRRLAVVRAAWDTYTHVLVDEAELDCAGMLV
jgi:hypothetical protein